MLIFIKTRHFQRVGCSFPGAKGILKRVKGKYSSRGEEGAIGSKVDRRWQTYTHRLHQMSQTNEPPPHNKLASIYVVKEEHVVQRSIVF